MIHPWKCNSISWEIDRDACKDLSIQFFLCEHSCNKWDQHHSSLSVQRNLCSVIFQTFFKTFFKTCFKTCSKTCMTHNLHWVTCLVIGTVTIKRGGSGEVTVWGQFNTIEHRIQCHRIKMSQKQFNKIKHRIQCHRIKVSQKTIQHKWTLKSVS